jgi:hypothetical protein
MSHWSHWPKVPTRASHWPKTITEALARSQRRASHWPKTITEALARSQRMHGLIMPRARSSAQVNWPPPPSASCRSHGTAHCPEGCLSRMAALDPHPHPHPHHDHDQNVCGRNIPPSATGAAAAALPAAVAQRPRAPRSTRTQLCAARATKATQPQSQLRRPGRPTCKPRAATAAEPRCEVAIALAHTSMSNSFHSSNESLSSRKFTGQRVASQPAKFPLLAAFECVIAQLTT